MNIPVEASLAPLGYVVAGAFVAAVIGQLALRGGRAGVTESLGVTMVVVVGVCAFAAFAVLSRQPLGDQVLLAGLAAVGIGLATARFCDVIAPSPRIAAQVPRGSTGVIAGAMAGTAAARRRRHAGRRADHLRGRARGMAAVLVAVVVDLGTGYAEAGRQLEGDAPFMWLARHMQGPLGAFAFAAPALLRRRCDPALTAPARCGHRSMWLYSRHDEPHQGERCDRVPVRRADRPPPPGRRLAALLAIVLVLGAIGGRRRPGRRPGRRATSCGPRWSPELDDPRRRLRSRSTSAIGGFPFLTQVAAGPVRRDHHRHDRRHAAGRRRAGAATLPDLTWSPPASTRTPRSWSQGTAKVTADQVTGTAVVSFATLQTLIDFAVQLTDVIFSEDAGALRVDGEGERRPGSACRSRRAADVVGGRRRDHGEAARRQGGRRGRPAGGRRTIWTTWSTQTSPPACRSCRSG